jgi:ubiquinone/menaquinone biosynthesis C-methylase UbiE
VRGVHGRLCPDWPQSNSVGGAAALINSLARRLPGHAELGQLMSATETRQCTAREFARSTYHGMGTGLKVLDLGCGEGRSADWFAHLDPTVHWQGVDIEGSPEVMARNASDPRMRSFDGIHLPFEAGSFDIVYSEQVLEHVRQPFELVAEVRRVLRPGGAFVGSVAYLEPYHSFSVFNFTPYGLKVLLEASSLEPVEFRHASDFFYKAARQMLGGFAFMSAFSRISALYGLISVLGCVTRADRRSINLLKIQYAGNFCFLARRSPAGAPREWP